MNEKRHYARVNFVEQANLNYADSSQDVTLNDISLKGALIELAHPIDNTLIGSPCHLSLRLADSSIVLDFDAQVAHSQQKNIGVTFTAMDSDSITHLRRLLELNTGNPEEIDRELSYMVQDR
nr:PilZ domain-containing protein [uncultured Desulfuromonas sp.]